MTVYTSRGAFGGVWCCELELSGEDGVRAVTPPTPEQRLARVLIRLHGEPVGYVELVRDGDGVDLRRVVAAAWALYGARMRVHLAAEGLGFDHWSRPIPATVGCPHRVPTGEPVSVVVCTRNRAATLRAALERLRAVTYPTAEFIVVDNAPVDEQTRRVVAEFADGDARFRYVREDRPGLSRARNVGLFHAGGTYVAYTDDDVSVDPQWLHGLVRGFRRRPDTGCVTGLVCTASITTGAEAYFDARAASWSTRCEPRVFDLDEHRPAEALYPYSAGIFGTGANVAFDRALLCGLGGFDEALGAGTPTGGGEDLDMFVRVLRAGRALVYEPSALVWHHHRADDESLRRQMFSYGTGLTAYLTKLLLHPDTRGDVLRRVPVGVRRMARIRTTTVERLHGRIAPPRGALLREFAGFAAGPLLYRRALRVARATARGPAGPGRTR
jgi:glycosyltransferase involved in cell wall biosynthesis